MTEDKMVGWHHRLNGHEFEQVPGDVKVREAWRAAGSQAAVGPPEPCGWVGVGDGSGARCRGSMDGRWGLTYTHC